jgi:hypothetical protein
VVGGGLLLLLLLALASAGGLVCCVREGVWVGEWMIGMNKERSAA